MQGRYRERERDGKSGNEDGQNTTNEERSIGIERTEETEKDKQRWKMGRARKMKELEKKNRRDER